MSPTLPPLRRRLCRLVGFACARPASAPSPAPPTWSSATHGSGPEPLRRRRSRAHRPRRARRAPDRGRFRGRDRAARRPLDPGRRRRRQAAPARLHRQPHPLLLRWREPAGRRPPSRGEPRGVRRPIRASMPARSPPGAGSRTSPGITNAGREPRCRRASGSTPRPATIRCSSPGSTATWRSPTRGRSRRPASRATTKDPERRHDRARPGDRRADRRPQGRRRDGPRLQDHPAAVARRARRRPATRPWPRRRASASPRWSTSATGRNGRSSPSGRSTRQARAAGKLTVRVSFRTPISLWEKQRDLVQAQGAGRRVALARRLQGLRGRLAGLLHRDLLRTLLRRPRDLRSLRQRHVSRGRAGAPHRRRRRRRLPDLDPRHRRARQRRHSRHLRARGEDQRPARPPAAHRARAAPAAVRGGPLRPSRSGGLDAAVHAADDGRWADKRLGAERSRDSYVFRSLLDAGARLAFGTDWPIAPLDPMAGRRRRGHPPDPRRQEPGRLASGAEDLGRRGAGRLHLRLAPGPPSPRTTRGLSRPESSPTSS